VSWAADAGSADIRVRVLLVFTVDTGEAGERLGAVRAHIEGSAVFFLGFGKLVGVHRGRGLAHCEPEAGGREGCNDGRVAEAVLLGLREIGDRFAEVLLLHAQVTHSGGGAAVLRVLGKQGLKTGFGFRKLVSIEGGEGGSFFRGAGDAGVHLLELGFVLDEAAF